MTTKNYENGLVGKNENGDNDITDDIIITGKVIFLDNSHANASDANPGTNRNFPKATLASSITATATDQADTIIIGSGHSETLTAGVTIADRSLKIYGLGSGTNKPKFISDGNIDLFDINNDHIEINNIRFPAAINTAVSSKIRLNGESIIVKNCDFEMGEFDLHAIICTASTRVPEINGCTFEVIADGPDDAFLINDANIYQVKVIQSQFDAGDFGFDNAAVYSTVLNIGFYYKNNILKNQAHIIHTASAVGRAVGTIADDTCRVEV